MAFVLASQLRLPTTVPMRDLGGVLVVKATIDENGASNMVLDTGATAEVSTKTLRRDHRASRSIATEQAAATALNARVLF
jgi:hypothetical protein